MECLNPYVYRKFVNKEIKIGVYHVEVTPHRRSLEGSEKPIKHCWKNLDLMILILVW